jgi:hypothetical protein
MDIREVIHMSSHGAVGELIPIEEVYKSDELVRRFNLPLNLDEIVEYLEVNKSDIFIDPSNMLSPVVYVKGFIYIEFWGFTLENIKVFNVKERIQSQTKIMDELIAINDWSRVFSLMEKKILIPNFLKIYHQIPSEQIVNVFSELWTRSESGFNLIGEDVLQYVYGHKELSAEWKERMGSLNKRVGNVEYITVYRGSGYGHRDGCSWTLSLKTAKWFANRFSKDGKIYKGRVAVDKVFDYFGGYRRNESEVLVNPKDVKPV